MFGGGLQPEVAARHRHITTLRYRLSDPFHYLVWWTLVDDLVGLGISGLHPNEKGAMDIRLMKRDYGGRICLLGNVDLNTLGVGTPAQVETEVRELIRDVGPGGGYILTSGNSLAGYLKPENVLALSEAAHTYGRYPIRVDG